MLNKSRFQRTIKKILVPMVGPALKIAHFKVLGHRIFINRLFINKYTRRIPVYSKILRFIDSLGGGARVREERNQDYQKWFKAHYPTEQDLTSQREENAKFNPRPKISILTPTYNTDPEFLKECIESVLRQSYDNWQLCIADDNSLLDDVRRIIEDYARKDSRIDFVFRKTNGHICEATNSALQIATGEYIALLDHDDVLWPNALHEVVKTINQHPNAKFVYSDEDKIDETGEKHLDPFFKPDWSPDFLRAINYITHFSVIERKLVNKLGGFRKGYEGAQDWDLFLRVSREIDRGYHVPTVLYSWRISDSSTAKAPSSKDYAYVNQKKALLDDVKARGFKASLEWEIPFSMWRIDYKLKRKALVSIIIPTKDQYEFIKRCLDSIITNTTYNNYELIIVDTGSSDPKVWELYNLTKQKLHRTRIVKWNKKFNFSAVCNHGVDKSKGDYLLFLNNDTEVISASWIEDMLGYAQQPGVGAVGAKLYYPNRKIQHAGIILGVGGQNGTPGIAGHFFPGFIDNPPQDPAQQTYIGGVRDFAAVTAACLMVSRTNYNIAGGFDPAFRIAFNDVDFCLKLLKNNLRNVYLPQVKLYHHESVSIGQPGSKSRDLDLFSYEVKLMLKKWGSLIENDPYYHPDFRKDIASSRLKV